VVVQVGAAAECRDGPLGHVGRQRLSVPSVPVLDLGHPFALDGSGQLWTIT